MKLLKYLTVFMMSFYLSGSFSEEHLLDCETWVNNKAQIDFLSASSQSKEMSPVLSETKDSVEEGVSYELLLKEDIVMGPVSVPLDEIEEMGYTGTSGGFLFFTPEESGYYNVMASQRIWIDFIDEQSHEALTSTAYTERECNNEAITKVVQFSLEKGKRYIFHLVNSSVSFVKVAIKKDIHGKKR